MKSRCKIKKIIVVICIIISLLFVTSGCGQSNDLKNAKKKDIDSCEERLHSMRTRKK